MTSPTRDPLPPPFPVGARLRYVGNRLVTTGLANDARVLIGPGLEVEIVKVVPGERGTGEIIELDDEAGEPVLDSTRDGRSVYEVTVERDGKPRKIGRAILPEWAAEWRVIDSARQGGAS